MVTYILGIHDGHNCGATLVADGVILTSISEERLTRRKNEVGYPEYAIAEILRLAEIDSGDLHEIVYATQFMHRSEYLQNLDIWYKLNLTDQRAAEQQPDIYKKILFRERRRERIEQVCNHLGFDKNKVRFLDHHLCHAAAAYFTAPKFPHQRKTLALTCDGSGDGISATVSLCNGNQISQISKTSRHCSLGKIYSRITMLLGMRPWEHEYKVMGLAPYASPKLIEELLPIFEGLLRLGKDGLSFERVGELSMNYCYEALREGLEARRFDVIAGAVQRFTENMLIAWVRACIKHTGIRHVVCGGGVFMNVKANMLLADLPEVSSIYFMPSASDESLSIGASLYRYYELSGSINHEASIVTNLYWGGDFTDSDVKTAMETHLSGHDYEILNPDDVDLFLAEELSQGKIYARCMGRMEWGARALGNRSILSSAADIAVVDSINSAIKMRDFWMPFAPSVLEENSFLYFNDPKHLTPQFMTMAYRAKPERYDHLVAASHRHDRTIRPQVVTHLANPPYHKLLTRFKKLTGRGVILNTSFNLHGYPIVYTPSDALSVFLKSGLENLALGNLIIRKKSKQPALIPK